MVTIAILGSSLFPTAPLTDALTGTAISDGKLALPVLYRVFAPICDTLDTLSLFSERQHIAFIATCALFYAIFRWRCRAPGATGWSRLGKESLLAALAFLSLVGVYAAGTMLPRPTARLAMSSSSAVVVDFHSHTSFSWDGRADFTPLANRRWHEEAGFDVAYITDHGTFWQIGAQDELVIDLKRVGEELGRNIELGQWLTVMTTYVGRVSTDQEGIFRITSQMLELDSVS